MLGYIEYLGIPASIAFMLVGIFLFINVIGEILEFKGKVVPEFMKVRKLFKRKKEEHKAVGQLPELLEEHKVLVADNKQMMQDYKSLAEENKSLSITNSEMAKTISEANDLMREIKTHYSADNIAKRDGWMQGVNEKFEDIYAKQTERDILVISLNEKIDKNNADTLSLLIDNKRNFILDFATKASDLDRPFTREQYKRFFKVHSEYEQIIEENGMTNGEVDIAYRMAAESYEERTKNNGFIEDIRGYTI